MFRKALILPFLVLAPAVGFGGCKKPADTKAIITVLDGSGMPVEGAYVKLYANPVPPLQPDFSRLNMEGYTAVSGKVSFDYTPFYKQGQAGFAVLDILAQKDTLTGQGIIRIEEEQTNEQTVTLLTPN
jgi:hypothetical protein